MKHLSKFFGWIFSLFRKKEKPDYTGVNNSNEWTIYERRVLHEVNLIRLEYKREPFTPDRLLHYHARMRTWDQHRGWYNLIKRTLLDMNFKKVSETLAINYEADQVAKAWLNSKSHKRTLLGRYKYCGIGKRENTVTMITGK